MPKVSVIVPVYGVEKYLRECLDSIVCQTLTDIEIILVDDGGKDACPQICDEYAQRDIRIKVIHKQNGGYGSACNVGLDAVSGEYLAIVEPDDYIESNMYEDLYKIAQANNSDIVKSCFYDNLQVEGCSHCNKTKWDVDKIPQQRSFTINECPLFLFYHPSIWSCIYKTEFIRNNNIRFVEAPGAGWTDNPFQVQTLCLAERINYTDNAYYYWRRVNQHESEDLKDFRIPFKRSEEIHAWLESQNVDDVDVLSSLYGRELGYISIAVQSAKVSDYRELSQLVRTMTSKIDLKVLKNSKYSSSSAIAKYKRYSRYFGFAFFKEKLDRNRKNLISMRVRDGRVYIKLFGKSYCL